MRLVFSFIAVLIFAASGPARAAVINIEFSGGGALGSWQEFITQLPGYDFLNNTPIGGTVMLGAYGETTITGSLTLDTLNFRSRAPFDPPRTYRGPPQPITHMIAAADGPIAPHVMSSADMEPTGYTLVQWLAGDEGRDWFYGFTQLRLIETISETSSGGNGEPYDYLRHRRFDTKFILLYMEGSDGFVSEAVLDGTLAPFVTGLDGCESCSIEMFELAYDEYHVVRSDADGQPVANYMYYENVVQRRSYGTLGYVRTTIETAVAVDEPATLGIAALAVGGLVGFRTRVRRLTAPPR